MEKLRRIGFISIDLRHTATTRYAEPPYSIDVQEYEYLKGNKIKYNHPDHMKINARIRAKIEAGDKAMYQWVSPDRIAIGKARFVLKSAAGKTEEIAIPSPEQWITSNAITKAIRKKLIKESREQGKENEIPEEWLQRSN